MSKPRNTLARDVVRILLREVLQQTPEALAEEVADAHRNGLAVRLTIMESRHGRDCKCAFSWEVVRDPRHPDVMDLAPAGGVH